MTNADTISNMPMTISQTPTTTANVTIDSNGAASTTIPAIRLITPKKMFQPRAGKAGSSMAGTVVATPGSEANADPNG